MAVTPHAVSYLLQSAKHSKKLAKIESLREVTYSPAPLAAAAPHLMRSHGHPWRWRRRSRPTAALATAVFAFSALAAAPFAALDHS